MCSPLPDDATPDVELDVEVVCALPDRQWCVPIRLPTGATVADALAEAASHFAKEAGVPDLARCAVGVWGGVADRDRPLRDGDRVEVYRPLTVDPREARRRAAEAGRTLGRAGRDPGEGD
ncbi:RnfH family protein [Lentisalinibacter sediminis]|uniref:RnfH family protein n=1 Tax=Lentisalinibacter sediminis TaxID=2992237 RepID=UPI003862D4A8